MAEQINKNFDKNKSKKFKLEAYGLLIFELRKGKRNI